MPFCRIKFAPQGTRELELHDTIHAVDCDYQILTDFLVGLTRIDLLTASFWPSIEPMEFTGLSPVQSGIERQNSALSHPRRNQNPAVALRPAGVKFVGKNLAGRSCLTPGDGRGTWVGSNYSI